MSTTSGVQQFIVVERVFVLVDGVRSGVVKSVVEWVARARAECVSQRSQSNGGAGEKDGQLYWEFVGDIAP